MRHLYPAILLTLMITTDLPAASPSRELLLFQEYPTVFSVSKKEQSVTESPSAVSVVTDDDIRASGATNIPDLLRMVAGVDVMAISATDYNVNIRGFNKESSHKLLVLIDGRSVYLDFMGIVLWESLPVTMEEIKRIEVVKGPGSAIWGGNAYSGVVNIVTKKPDEMIGNTISASYGERNTTIGSVTHGGRLERTSYKITAGWKQENNWDDNKWGPSAVREADDKAMEEKKGSFLLQHDMMDGAILSLSGGIDKNFGEVLTALDVYRRDNTSSYLKLDFQKDWLRFHTFWNGLDTGILEKLAGGNYNIKTNTYDFELQGVFDSPGINSLTTGLSYRLNTVQSDLLSGYNQQEIWGVYAQDDFKPLAGLVLSAGARYDYHPLIGGNTSPRAAVIYTPVEGHTVRISYSTAYSLPTFVESYISRSMPIAPGVNLVSQGNRDVGPEKMRSWEAGYQGHITERVKGSIDLFRNELEDFITFLPSPGNPLVYSCYNRGKYIAEGGEAALEYYVGKDLTAEANYSYQFIRNDEAGSRVSYSPLSKVNAEIRYSPKNGLTADASVNYVGETNWTSNSPSEDWLPPNSITTRTGTDPIVDAYMLFNIKAGYRFKDAAEISVSAFNLFDNRHREFIAGDEIGRKVMLNLLARF